jgi:hypothetical protein
MNKITATEDIGNTSFQGDMLITYAELVAALGDPHYTGGDKTTAEWDFITEDGIVFTIYDYKQDETPTFKYEWHIGGADQKVIAIVKQLFPTNKVEGK